MAEIGISAVRAFALSAGLIVGAGRVGSAEAQACRVVDQISVSNAEITRALGTDEADFAVLRGSTIGDEIAFLPVLERYARPAPHVLRVGHDGSVRGTTLTDVNINGVMLAGRTAAEQILTISAFDGASVSVWDPATRTLGAPHAVIPEDRFIPRLLEVETAPARDGLRSTFMIGNTVLGPYYVGVVGADGALAGPVTSVCSRESGVSLCACSNVFTTATGSIASWVEQSAGGDDRLRTLTLDADGHVVADASLRLPSRGCPNIAQTPSGLMALTDRRDGTSQLVPLAHPERATVVRAVGLAGEGSDVLLLQSWPAAVVRSTDGVVDESSRLTLAGASTVATIASDGDGMRLSYQTESGLEIVKVSCR